MHYLEETVHELSMELASLKSQFNELLQATINLSRSHRTSVEVMNENFEYLNNKVSRVNLLEQFKRNRFN